MTRIVAALLVLLTQVFAICAPGSVVVCSDAVGNTAIELAGSSCCRAAQELRQTAQRPATPDRAPAVRAADESCRDATVRPDQAALARSSARSRPAAETPDLPATILAWRAPPRIQAAVSAHPTLQRAPPAGVPRAFRTPVLRC